MIASTQWRPRPGKFSTFIDNVMTASGHITRLGGTVRVVQCMMGKHPMSVTVAVTYEDLEHRAQTRRSLPPRAAGTTSRGARSHGAQS